MAKRQRSPNYPVIDLKKAVARTREIYDKAKGHSVPIATVQECWGLKPESSMGYQIVAALRAYGLVEVTGSLANRQIRVLEAGRRILLNAADAAAILEGCAKAPPMNAELLDMATEDGLPPRDTMRHYLVFDRPDPKFNEESVDSVIDRFMDTVRYAKLDSSGIIEGGEEDNGDDEAPSEDETEKRKVRKGVTAVLPLPIPMEDGTICIVDIPRMTSATFAFFTKQLEAYKSAIVLPPVADTTSDKSDDD